MTGRVRVIIAGVTCAGIVGLALPGLAGDRDSGPRTTAASEQQADRLASLQRVAARALAAHMEWGIPEPRGRAAPIPTIEQSATPPQLSAEESATRLTRDRLTYAALFATSNAETQRLESLALESSNTAAGSQDQRVLDGGVSDLTMTSADMTESSATLSYSLTAWSVASVKNPQGSWEVVAPQNRMLATVTMVPDGSAGWVVIDLSLAFPPGESP